MRENSLYKAIYNFASIKEVVKKLWIQPAHIYAWIKGERQGQRNGLKNKTLRLTETVKKKVFFRNLCRILHKFL